MKIKVCVKTTDGREVEFEIDDSQMYFGVSFIHIIPEGETEYPYFHKDDVKEILIKPL